MTRWREYAPGQSEAGALHSNLKINKVLNLEPIKSPAAKFQPTSLFIKRKVANINITGGFKDCWRFPLDQPIMVECRLCHGGDVVVTVCTETMVECIQSPTLLCFK